MNQIVIIGKELGVPVCIDTYMMPAQWERFLLYNEQAHLNPKMIAKVCIRILKERNGNDFVFQIS